MLQLIDWTALAYNTLWITGAVVALSVVSIGQWESCMRGMRLRAWLGRSAVQVAFSVAAVFFSGGMFGTSSATLERVLWGILAVAFAVQLCARAWPAKWREHRV